MEERNNIVTADLTLKSELLQTLTAMFWNAD